MVSDDHARHHASGVSRFGEELKNAGAPADGGSARLDPREQLAIVIIDDDDAVRESTRLLLEVYGYIVRDHASAQSYLASDSGKAGFLLVDQHMPGMTGIELLELLHTKPHPPPALMMTGRTDAAIEARLARIGVTLLHKPVTERQLIALIEEAERRRATSQTPPDAANDPLP